MQTRFFTLKKWSLAVAVVFSIAGLIFPPISTRANVSEDQLLADFARSLGLTKEMAANYGNLLQGSDPSSGVTMEYCVENYQDPACEQLLDSTSGNVVSQKIEEYINSGQPTPGNCSSAASCEIFCDNLLNSLACLDFSKAISGINELPPEGQALANELYDPAKAANLVQQVLLGTTPGRCQTGTQCLSYCESKPNECQNFLPLLGVEPEPVQEPSFSEGQPDVQKILQNYDTKVKEANTKTTQTNNCLNNLLNDLGEDFSSNSGAFINYFKNVNACITPAAPQVLGATTEQVKENNKPAISLPTGQLMKTADSLTVYYVNNLGLKIPKMTEKVFLSYGSKYSEVRTVTKEELELYPTAQYIQQKASADIYRIDIRGNKYLLSAQAKQRLAVQPFSIMTVNKVELDSYKTGEPIQE